MPLPYTLHKNSIRKGGAISYRAVAKNVTYVSIEHAIQYLTQPGSILKQTECHAVIHGFLDYLDEQLAEGNGFLSPYFRLTPGVRGVFDHQHDPYDAKRHRPGVNFRMGRKMQQAVSCMKLHRINSNVPAPLPTGFQGLGIRHGKPAAHIRSGRADGRRTTQDYRSERPKPGRISDSSSYAAGIPGRPYSS